jgi:hypothetical protein
MDSRLLPFFSDYYRFGYWPDGRGRLYQPLKLIEAFSCMQFYWSMYEAKHAEEQQKEIERRAKETTGRIKRH